MAKKSYPMFSLFNGVSSRNSTSQPDVKSRRLRCRVGPTIETLEICDVNNEETPHFIDSPYFTGNVVVRIRDFNGIVPPGETIKNCENYFGPKKRNFSIQVCGRFKHDHSSEDVMFGADFDRKWYYSAKF